jgi:hypothetical protein
MLHRKNTRVVRNTFAKLRIIFVTPLSVLPSICRSTWYISAANGRIFYQIKFDIKGFLKNMSRKFKYGKNLARITGTLHEYLCKLMVISSWILLTMRMFQTKFVYKIKSRIFWAIIFPPKIVSFMRKCGKIVRDRQATDDKNHGTDEMRVSCPITKARIQTHTQNIQHLLLTTVRNL